VSDSSLMNATTIDENHRLTLPESICSAAGIEPNDRIEWRAQDGEIRGRKLPVRQEFQETFSRGSLLKYLTPERDKEQIAILAGCVQNPTSHARVSLWQAKR
jgi:bifunctional DNA-binding transcriptional regulator/antitoxin component of YhaV-PrlF toxin-antitoxin module